MVSDQQIAEVNELVNTIYAPRVNELTLENLGTASGLTSHVANISASRMGMVSSHISQCVVVEGAEPRRIRTGSETEYAKTTWKSKIPKDSMVVKVIDRFPRGVGLAGFAVNPETLVIYENLKAREEGRMVLGCVSINSHHSIHQTFGFKFKRNKDLAKLLVKDHVFTEETILSHSPNVKENGDWAFGVNANVAFLSIPQIIQDGYVVSRSFCERLAATTITTRQASWGKQRYPLNTYGDAEHFRAFPEVGQVVREDGILFALREYDPLLCVVEQNAAALRNIDTVYDKVYYAPPGAEVIDIKILHDPNQIIHPTPVGMEAQTQRYANAQNRFYDQILDVYQEYKRKFKHLELTDEFHNLVVRAIQSNPRKVIQNPPANISLTNRATPLDDWTVIITLAKRVVPREGFKITGLSGDKGVNTIAPRASNCTLNTFLIAENSWDL